MNEQLETSAHQIEDGAETIVAGARTGLGGLVTSARESGRRAAETVTRGKAPLATLSGLGLKLSAVSHRTTDRVLKQQTAMASNQLDLLAERLRAAADAGSLRELVARQVRLTPEQFARLGRDARESLAIIANGGSEARDVIRGSIGELTGRKPAPRRRAKAAKAATGAKRTAKKPARKKTARKTARKAAPAATA